MTEATSWSPQGSKDKFNLDDFAYLGSPIKRMPKGIDYDSFEGVSSHAESPKRGKALDGSVWTPSLNIPGTPINVNGFIDCNSGFTPLLQQKGELIPVLNSGNIPSSNDWGLYSNGTHSQYVSQTTTDPFSIDMNSPPPRKGIRKKYEDSLLLSPSPGFLSGGSALSDGGSFRVLDDLDSSSTGISLFNKTTGIPSPKLGIAERHSENAHTPSPALDTLIHAGTLILVPPPPESPNGLLEDHAARKTKGSKKKEGGSSVKKEKKSRKKIESPEEGLKIDTGDNSPPKIPQVTCSCKKTRCLKMYCDCFRFSKFCWEKCNCIKDGSEGSCCNLNTPECIIERDKAIKSITERNPTAFNAKIVKSGSEQKEHLSGCHCKNSKCLKKYCECYTAMVPCSERCRCMNCQNTIHNPDLKYEQPSHITAAYNEVEGVREHTESSSFPNNRSSTNSLAAEPEELTPSMNMNRIDINKETPFLDLGEKARKENAGFLNDQSPPAKPNFEVEGGREMGSEMNMSTSNQENCTTKTGTTDKHVPSDPAAINGVEHGEEQSISKEVATGVNCTEAMVMENERSKKAVDGQTDESFQKLNEKDDKEKNPDDIVREEGEREEPRIKKEKEQDKEEHKGENKIKEKKKIGNIKDGNAVKKKMNPRERKKKTSEGV